MWVKITQILWISDRETISKWKIKWNPLPFEMTFSSQYPVLVGFPSGSIVENPPADAGDVGDTSSTPGWRRYPGGGNGSPLWYSCLGNAMDRGAWWATVHGVEKESDITEHPCTLSYCCWTLHTNTAQNPHPVELQSLSSMSLRRTSSVLCNRLGVRFQEHPRRKALCYTEIPPNSAVLFLPWQHHAVCGGISVP